MAITIVKPTDGILTENLIVLIYGTPGVGKSSLAFSANKPLMLDFDLGAQRTVGRKDAVRVKTWTDISDLSAADLKDFDTIIIDTAGRALEVLSASLIATNPRLARNTGEMTLQGYGALGTAFKNWLIKLRNFNKDIILICHDKEDKDGDNRFIRPEAMGSSRNELTKIADLMGYLFVVGNDRMIDFNPTESHLGKNCAGIAKSTIPDIKDNANFMADLLQFTKDAMNTKSEEQVKAEKIFNDTITIIDETITAESLTNLTGLETIQKSQPLKHYLMKHATKLGFVYDKESKCFKNNEIVEMFENSPIKERANVEK